MSRWRPARVAALLHCQAVPLRHSVPFPGSYMPERHQGAQQGHGRVESVHRCCFFKAAWCIQHVDKDKPLSKERMLLPNIKLSLKLAAPRKNCHSGAT